MNKNFKFYLSVWAVLFALFNISVFVTPSETETMTKFGGAFWVGYIFITIAFIGQLAVSYFAFNAKNMQKLFYKIPLISISWTGLILTLVFGALCMVIPNLPNWIGAIACLVILGLSAIALVKANVAADLVGEIDDKIKEQTAFIKILTADAEHLMNTAKTAELKAEAKRVYEAVRYSDPMSNPALSGIETEISLKFNQLSSEITAESENVKAIADELITLIADRNSKCKVLK